MHSNEVIVKSYTMEGEKAKTRAIVYCDENNKEVAIILGVIYFTRDSDREHNPDIFLRRWGDRSVFGRLFPIKLSTLSQILEKLQGVRMILDTEQMKERAPQDQKLVDEVAELKRQVDKLNKTLQRLKQQLDIAQPKEHENDNSEV